MKKFIKISLFTICLFTLCVGCQGDITRALRHNGYSLAAKKIVCNVFYGEEATEHIRFLTSAHAITDNGDIYEMSPTIKYSNNQNCRKAGTDIRVKALYGDTVALATNGKIYNLVASNEAAAYTEIGPSNNAYEQYNLLFTQTNAIKFVSAGTDGLTYGLSPDGNVYGYTLQKDNNNGPLRIAGTVIAYNKMDYGNIIDFGYAGKSLATYVKTSDKVYHLSITNQKECSNYADIPCNYIMAEDEVLEKYSDYILAYNGSSIYTTYKKYFTLGGNA